MNTEHAKSPRSWIARAAPSIILLLIERGLDFAGWTNIYVAAALWIVAIALAVHLLWPWLRRIEVQSPFVLGPTKDDALTEGPEAKALTSRGLSWKVVNRSTIQEKAVALLRISATSELPQPLELYVKTPAQISTANAAFIPDPTKPTRHLHEAEIEIYVAPEGHSIEFKLVVRQPSIDGSWRSFTPLAALLLLDVDPATPASERLASDAKSSPLPLSIEG
jgi:hypothetical protein